MDSSPSAACAATPNPNTRETQQMLRRGVMSCSSAYGGLLSRARREENTEHPMRQATQLLDSRRRFATLSRGHAIAKGLGGAQGSSAAKDNQNATSLSQRGHRETSPTEGIPGKSRELVRDL